ncbi:MAG: COX15/CtaA family protein [Thaumarchaeota archaeon]|nr:COX15/CtaA family protein [Nitrososphaerota archaeon]
MSRIVVLSISYAISTFLLIVVGAYVRAFGAGMGCGPNWPTCNGYIIPPNLTDPKVFLEFIHRVIALIPSVLVVLTVGTAWTGYRKDRAILFWSTVTGVFFLAQVLLGMLVVLWELQFVTSASHLGLATATFGSAVVLAVVATHREG